MEQMDLSPAGFAGRLSELADQLCTGDMTPKKEQDLKNQLFEEIGRLKLLPTPETASPAGASATTPAQVTESLVHEDLAGEIDRLEKAADRLETLIEKAAAIATRPAPPAAPGGAPEAGAAV